MSILFGTSPVPMVASDNLSPASPTPSGAVMPGIVSAGWLGASSVNEVPGPKMGRAFSTSVIVHGILLALILVAISIKPAVDLLTKNDDKVNVVFLQQPGPGGGGGGSPQPAPPKPMEIPKHTTPPPIPVTPVPVIPPPPPPPTPTLNAPIQTTTDMLQASGVSSVSLASYGGGGRGTGVGAGTGNGVGQGTGGGFGGGAYQPGNGVINPRLLIQKEPQYTSEAMRAKIQGDVELEAVILPNGLVGDIRVVKSLDDKFGLDQEAIKAAKQWVFQAGTRFGEKVPVIVTLILTFRLH